MSEKPRLVYDGICNLCIGAVKFLHMIDKGGLVQYVPYQLIPTTTRSKYGLTLENMQGRMHLLANGSLSSGSIAIMEICRLLTPFSFLCNLLRTRAAENLYDWFATKRYRIFGCRQSCYILGSKNSGVEHF